MNVKEREEGTSIKLESADTPVRENVFVAIAGVASLLAGLLYLAGFAYRWSYYYNFGVQHVVFKQSVESFLITAFELFRTLTGWGLLLVFVGIPLTIFEALFAILRTKDLSGRLVSTLLAVHFKRHANRGRLLPDFIRVSIIACGTYHVASTIGYAAFLAHAKVTTTGSLPSVTTIYSSSTDNAAASIACNSPDDAWRQYSFIGDKPRLEGISGAHRTCNWKGRTEWRLLYRDKDEVYIFAAMHPEQVDKGGRPLTLVLPNRDIVLVLE